MLFHPWSRSGAEMVFVLGKFNRRDGRTKERNAVRRLSIRDRERVERVRFGPLNWNEDVESIHARLFHGQQIIRQSEIGFQSVLVRGL